MKEIMRLGLDFCPSGICNRGCRHCADDCNMNGKVFSLKNALLVSREIRRLSKFFSDKYDIYFIINLTGGGEPLMNWDLLGILDLIVGLNKNVQCNMVTSGADPQSSVESELLSTLARRPYVNQMRFALSFNQFQAGFPERFHHSMNLFFENGIDEVGVKVCMENQYQKTIRFFIKTLDEYCVDNVVGEKFHSVFVSEDAERFLPEIFRRPERAVRGAFKH